MLASRGYATGFVIVPNIINSVSMQRRKSILAVASGGGHWVQLLRLRPAFRHHSVTYVTTSHGALPRDEEGSIFVVPDANFSSKVRLIYLGLRIAALVLWVRPDVVVSTGAAPGFFAILFGRLLGAKTIWFDSIANADEMSLAGKHVRRFSTHWLSQWESVAQKSGAKYVGAVIEL